MLSCLYQVIRRLGLSRAHHGDVCNLGKSALRQLNVPTSDTQLLLPDHCISLSHRCTNNVVLALINEASTVVLNPVVIVLRP